MYVGKTLFAQIMEFVPWTSFTRIVQRRDGDSGVRSLSCAEQFRAMAFAQLTWRESLRDIEASLSANASKLYAMGFRSAVKRSTLADANESRDLRIWSDLAALLIRRARKLYASESLGVELDNTVYALDSSTIDLCLSVFDWAPFRSTKAAIKLHTLLDLRGAIPAFIHISDGKLHDVNVLDMLTFEAGAFYVMDRGYVDFARLFALHQAGAFFVTRAKSPMATSVAEQPSASAPCEVRLWVDSGCQALGAHRRLYRPYATLVDGPLTLTLQFRGGAPQCWIGCSAGRAAQPAACEPNCAHQRPVRMSWARLLKRVIELDLEHCPNCGGALKISAAIVKAPVIEKILTYLGLQAPCAAAGSCAWTGTANGLRG